jgi:imidazolonepropionase-like amidohydrolase
MSFCDHCAGQRFDRAQVLRALRAARRKYRREKTSGAAEEVIALAIEAVRTLEIPHFDPIDDEVVDGEVIH